jgi:hypothetical protein
MNRCKWCFLILTLTVLGTASATERDDLSCFDHLVLPGYSSRYARKGQPGPATVMMKVRAGGSAESVDVESAQLALQAEVKSAMESVRFKPECAGDTVVLHMSFELEGPPVDFPFTTIVFDAPNKFTIVSQPGKGEVFVHMPAKTKKQPTDVSK